MPKAVLSHIDFMDFLAFLKSNTAKGPLFNTNNKIARIIVVQKEWHRTQDMAPKMNCVASVFSKSSAVECKGQGYRVNANENL